MNFVDAGFNDFEVGTTLFKNLDLNEEHFSSPQTMAKVKLIAQFLNDHPDPMFVIGLTRYNNSPNMDNLEYLHSYALLNRQMQDIEDKKKKLKEQLSEYGK